MVSQKPKYTAFVYIDMYMHYERFHMQETRILINVCKGQATASYTIDKASIQFTVTVLYTCMYNVLLDLPFASLPF